MFPHIELYLKEKNLRDYFYQIKIIKQGKYRIGSSPLFNFDFESRTANYGSVNGIPLDNPYRYMRNMDPGHVRRKKTNEGPKIQFVDSQGNEIEYADPLPPRQELDLKTTASLSTELKGYATMAARNSQLVLANTGSLSIQKFVEKQKQNF